MMVNPKYNHTTNMYYDEEDESLTIEERIYNFLKRGSVTFADIQRFYGRGEYSLEFDKESNVWLWCNLQFDVCEAITKLYDSKKIFYYPAHLLTYAIDGIMLDMPIVRTAKRQYKTPHWMPVVIYRTDSPPKEMTIKQKKSYVAGGWKIK